ncbi:MAG: sugar ABC transporter ATP-binding protein [Actinobacteria bacterium]|nr:sugar ABC transporter ATP-binding protein [Actinomycetota bacterium]
MDEYILKIQKLNKYFADDQSHVLTDVDLTLKRGSILGLVGENGAGKSTMMNILGGVKTRTSGDIFIDGSPYLPNNPIDAEKMGIAFIHQEFDLFNNLTVAENMYLDNTKSGKGGFFAYKAINSEAKRNLNAFDIDIDVNKKIEELPMGLRQLVEIAKAIRKDAKIIIFDEPTTSLSNVEKEKLFKIIRDLSDEKISMIYISHTLDDVIKICDEIAVLRDGLLIGQKSVNEITKDEIITMMVGRKMENLYPYVQKQIGRELLTVKNIMQGKKLRNISFSINRGEITGLFGLMGSGRSEMVNALYGMDPIDSGSVYFNGEEIKKLNPQEWIKRGMAYITENRREEGLLLPQSVKENLILVKLKEMKKKLGAVDFKRAEKESDLIVKQINIKTYNKSRQSVALLSGGNQQKVVIGKWLLTEPKILILDEPTKGIDVGAKFEIYNYVNNLAKNNAAILFISSEMEELMGICDRILIMSKGQISGMVTRNEFSQEKIIRLAIGGNSN